MVNKDITIQLLDKNAGYVEVLQDTGVPLNFGVAEIRDITTRKGAFSKTITLAGTKNNAKMLNHYYDLNVTSGVFDINKKQRVSITQNGVIVLSEGYMQLISVNKRQNTMTEDDIVSYTVEIKDAVADFFTTINGKELTDLTIVGPSNLLYDAQTIANSFTNNYPDIYKFFLPWISGNQYSYKDFNPAIFAKWYWDRIHEAAGFAYQWSDLAAQDVRFDKLLIPYNGDSSKSVTQQYVTQNTFSVDTSTLPPTDFVVNSLGPNNLPVLANNFNPLIFDFTPIIDPNNEWQGNFANQSFIPIRGAFPPDFIDMKWEFKFDLIIRNNESQTVFQANSAQTAVEIYLGVINDVTSGLTTLPPAKVSFNTINAPTFFTFPPNGDNTQLRCIYPPSTFYSNPLLPVGDTFAASGHQTYTLSPSAFLAGEPLKFRVFLDAINFASPFYKYVSGNYIKADVDVILRVTYSKVTITPSQNNGLINGSPIDLNLFIPTKIKQSDFIKSICTMFNLYCEPSKTNPNTLIYKRRDQFYDQGRTVDWTEKLARDKEQDITFLPEITAKSMVLTYKYDSNDLSSKAYTDATKKTYGQLRYVFDNEWVKGEDRKELIFAPTLNWDTSFGANVPWYTDPRKPASGIRIVQDGGILNLPAGSSYFIENYAGEVNPLQLTTYPFVGHFDNPEFPTYDINFGICDFYPSRPYTIQNNLYYYNWLRTISNINTGKMLTAYFWLTEADIHLLRMSDIIRIDNGYFYINRVIDYNAAKYGLTKVELITVEKESSPGVNSGNQIKPFDIKSWLESIGSDVIAPGPRGNGTVSTGYFPDRIKIKTAGRLGRGISTSIADDADSAMIFGDSAILGTGFRGIIIGDKINAGESGIYIGEQKLTSNGLEYTGLKIIDGGYETVMNLNKDNEIDFIDAGEDVVRNLNGSKARPFIDGGKKT